MGTVTSTVDLRRKARRRRRRPPRPPAPGPPEGRSGSGPPCPSPGTGRGGRAGPPWWAPPVDHRPRARGRAGRGVPHPRASGGRRRAQDRGLVAPRGPALPGRGPLGHDRGRPPAGVPQGEGLLRPRLVAHGQPVAAEPPPVEV